LEKEIWRKEKKELRQREEEHQRDLAYRLEADHVTAME